MTARELPMNRILRRSSGRRRSPRRLAVALLTAVSLAMLVGVGWSLAQMESFGIDQVLRSEVVCSPGTDVNCPAESSQSLTVPPGTQAVRIDVFWRIVEDLGQPQPNEHSNFLLSTNGQTLGEVYCPDFGDTPGMTRLCGTVQTNVSPGETLTLMIQHADTQPGPTNGSHYQIWAINWLQSPVTPSPSPTPEAFQQVLPYIAMQQPPTPTTAPVVIVVPTATPIPTYEVPEPVAITPLPVLPVTGGELSRNAKVPGLWAAGLVLGGTALLALLILHDRRG